MIEYIIGNKFKCEEFIIDTGDFLSLLLMNILYSETLIICFCAWGEVINTEVSFSFDSFGIKEQLQFFSTFSKIEHPQVALVQQQQEILSDEFSFLKFSGKRVFWEVINIMIKIIRK